MTTERRDELLVSACFALTAGAAVALGVVYWQGGQPQVEGGLLALAGAGLGAGMAVWAHRLLPGGGAVEDRESLASPQPERDAFAEDLERGDTVLRRHVITRALGTAVVAFGAAMLFPIRSLGPRPSGDQLDDTPWDAGRRLVTADGTAVRASDVPRGGLVTVFPEGSPNSEVGQAVLVNVTPLTVRSLPGRATWSPEGLVAYSKVCTHAGCPVGLYEAGSHQLLCPCHQSTFDVLDGARPVFGPAAAPLPQLPLAIDADGFVRASGPLSGPPGPSFWNRRS